jgi:hypothetical protein
MAVLVKFEKDWADEFDVENFYARKDVTVEEETTAIQAELDRGEERSFGSNEYWEAEELSIDDYTITEITDEEFEVLVKLFSVPGSKYVAFGTGVY